MTDIDQVKEITHKKICVLAHPRCGTGYMSKCLQEMGIDVGHEVMGEDGTVNWTYLIENEKPFNWIAEPRSSYEFDIFVHLVRDPFTAIPSIFFTETCETLICVDPSWGNVYVSTMFRYKHCGIIEKEDIGKQIKGPIIDRVVKSFLIWNDMIRTKFPDSSIIRLEKCEQDMNKKFRNNNFFEDKLINFPTEQEPVNKRTHNSFTKRDWKKINRPMMKLLDNFCKMYSYPLLSERVNEMKDDE